jgi:hypothetical protein
MFSTVSLRFASFCLAVREKVKCMHSVVPCVVWYRSKGISGGLRVIAPWVLERTGFRLEPDNHGS